MKESVSNEGPEWFQKIQAIKKPIHEKEKLLGKLSGIEAENLKEEINRDWINFEVMNIVKHLSEQWGVEDLSTIEGVRLRHIVEEGMKQRAKELDLVKKKEIKGGAWLMQRTVEYTARWLDELYNIRDIYVQDYTGNITREMQEHLRILRDKAHKP